MTTDHAAVQPLDKRARLPRLTAGRFGTMLFLLIALPCFVSLIWTLNPPSGQEHGERYNDLRYNETMLIDGQDVELKIREQPPGSVHYARTVPNEAGDAEILQDFTGFEFMGTDQQGRSLFVRCLLGGAISLGVGICAALMAVFIGVTWGATAGYLGGRTDSLMMRIVDILYGLPYLLLVVLLSVAVNGIIDNLEDGFIQIPYWAIRLWEASPAFYILACVGVIVLLLSFCALFFWLAGTLIQTANGFFDLVGFSIRLITVLITAGTILTAVWVAVLGLLMPGTNDEMQAPIPKWIVTLLADYSLLINLLILVIAIGGVSWLTMARVIRGQVLSLRTEPFIEAARAQGMSTARIMRVHLLPNLIGPIVVYTTLVVPQAILQESFLSFLGIGVTDPLPSWGQLASIGIYELPALAVPQLSDQFKWWLLVFPCVLLGLTLLSLNFMGDAMRERFDPRSKKRGA